MQYVRETDKTHKGYKYYIDIEDQISQGDKKEYLANLTKEQKEDLNKYKAVLRQRKFSSQDNNKEEYNKKRAEHIKYLRETKPEIMAEQNRRDVKNHRLRNKAKEQALINKVDEAKAKQTLTDALKAKKARKEMKDLKNAKETQKIATDILNDIVDTIPKKAQQKRNREAVEKHRAKQKAGEEVKTYNTRSRGKK